MQTTIYGLSVLGTFGLFAAGILYSSHKIASIWAIFTTVVIYSLAFTLYWHQSVAQEKKNHELPEKAVQLTKPKDSPGGVQQTMQNSPGSAQVVISHAEKVTLNATPASRTIPADLATALVDNLKNREPRTIEIRSILGDQESLRLATQIAELFEKAEWQVSKTQWSYSKPFSDIVFERGSGTGSHEELEYVMLTILKYYGHKCQLYTQRDLPSNHYRLTVGSR